MFAIEVNEILQVTLPKLRKGNGDVRQRGDDNICTAVLHEYSHVLEYRVASFLVRHTWYQVLDTRYIQAQTGTRGTGVCFARSNSL